MMLQILFVIFLHDIWFYISHVILHEPLCYELFHKHNHISSDAYGYWVETLFQGCGLYLACAFVTYHSIFISLLWIQFRSMLCHDPRFTWIVGNHSLLHHKYPHTNFGEPWIDYFCGTKIENN